MSGSVTIGVHPDSKLEVDLDGTVLDNIGLKSDLLDKIKASADVKLDGNLLNSVNATANLNGDLLKNVNATATVNGNLLNNVKVGAALDGALLDKISATINANGGFSASIKELAPLLLTLLWTEIPQVKIAVPIHYKLGFSLFGLELFALKLSGESKAVSARNPQGDAGGIDV